MDDFLPYLGLILLAAAVALLAVVAAVVWKVWRVTKALLDAVGKIDAALQERQYFEREFDKLFDESRKSLLTDPGVQEALTGRPAEPEEKILPAPSPAPEQVDRETTPPGLEKDHRDAAQTAKALVTDLFMFNKELVAKCRSTDEVRELLDTQLRGARRAFEARVPKHVWEQSHYLQMEFDKVIEQARSGDSIAEELDQALRDRIKNLNA